MYTIKSLKESSFDEIYTAFRDGFRDYEFQINRVELSRMLNRRGFVPELSFAAFDGPRIIAFTLNGIGEFNGEKTAYDTGTATLPDFRGQGLAAKIFEYSVPFLKDAGISQYLLEVLQHNDKAVSVYKKVGFEVTREFNYFVQDVKDVYIKDFTMNQDYYTRFIDLSFKKEMEEMWDFQPSWQNNFAAIQRKKDDFKIIGMFKNNELVGYIIVEINSGDIPQISVKKSYRRQKIGLFLFKKAYMINQSRELKMINAQTDCESLTKFLNKVNMPVSGKQYEMIKEI